MGLNLETLIGILVILILLILADGLRRMFRERQGRLRMRIDPRYRDAPEAEEEENYHPEVIGSSRVVRRSEQPVYDEPQADDQPDVLPPTMMEPDEGVSEARAAEQQSLFNAEEPDASEEAPVQAETPPAPEPEPTPPPHFSRRPKKKE